MESLAFLDDGSKDSLENTSPYAFCGNDRTNVFSCRKLTCGTHTVTAIPYSRGGGKGPPGPPLSVTFTVVCDPTVPMPPNKRPHNQPARPPGPPPTKPLIVPPTKPPTKPPKYSSSPYLASPKKRNLNMTISPIHDEHPVMAPQQTIRNK